MQNDTRKIHSRSEKPVYAVPVSSNKTGLFITVAVLAGLAVGGFVFYWVHTTRSAVSQNNIPAVSTESTPASVTPPPEADVAQSTPRRKPHPNATKHVSNHKDDFTPPVLLNPPNGPVSSTTQAPAAQPPNTPASHAPVSDTPRRAAVQDPGAAYSPMPMPMQSSTGASAPPAPASSPAPIAQAPAPSDRPVLIRHPGSASDTPTAQTETRAPAKSAYSGPSGGTATWTGKLEKNETLTITGGTPSKGVLAGAGLPGVPVRVTVDQANLGFVEMPDASNGYRRLVIRSHAKHDKITIHWTAIE